MKLKQPILAALLGSQLSILSVVAIAVIFHSNFLALSIAWLESGAITTTILIHYYQGRVQIYEATIASLELKPLGVEPATVEGNTVVPRGTSKPKPTSLGLDDL
jgi:hypothetical protein